MTKAAAFVRAAPSSSASLISRHGGSQPLNPDRIARRPMPSHDHGARRQTKRWGRERGCWAYIDAGALRRAGIDPEGPPPTYRTWAAPRGSVLVRLYTQ